MNIYLFLDEKLGIFYYRSSHKTCDRRINPFTVSEYMISKWNKNSRKWDKVFKTKYEKKEFHQYFVR